MSDQNPALVAYRAGPGGQQIPQYQNPQASPGIGGAIMSAITALASAFAPRSIAQRGQKIDQQVAEGEGNPGTSPQGNDLGNQF